MTARLCDGCTREPEECAQMCPNLPEDCEFSDLDVGYCLVHACYGSDPEHPHVWEYCSKDGCTECAKYDENGNPA